MVVVVVTTLPTPKAVSSTAERCVVVVDVVVVPLFTVCLQVDEADFRGRAQDTSVFITVAVGDIKTTKGFRSKIHPHPRTPQQARALA